MRLAWACRAFATKSVTARDSETVRKAVNEITKLSHVRLDLNKMTSDSILPLLRQNVKNRKAFYANPDLVAQLHGQYKTILFELEQLR